MPQIKKVLGIISRGGKVKHVLFTGHSAGGSVASLLWLKVLRLSAKKCKLYTFTSLQEVTHGFHLKKNGFTI